LYVDVNFDSKTIASPKNSISKSDAEKVIKAVRVGLYQIYFITDELGEQIGTKGFMK